MTQGIYPAGINPVAYEQIDVADVVTSLTVPTGAIRAVLVVEAQSIRYRTDGKYPTSSVGTLMIANSTFDLIGTETMKAFRVIRATGSSAKLSVNYYGDRGELVFDTTTTTTTTPAPTTTTPAPTTTT